MGLNVSERSYSRPKPIHHGQLELDSLHEIEKSIWSRETPWRQADKSSVGRYNSSIFFFFFNFTILYSFCQISKWIRHRYDLIRCDEANRLGDNCHEGRSSDFQFPRSRRHGTQGHMGKHLGQSGGREGKGQHGHKPVVWLLWERRGRAA